MRRVVVALAIAGAWLLAPISAYSDTDLEALVAEAFHARVQDAGLHEIAHQRAVEISCEGCFSHDGIRPGTAEVLAYNGLGAERAVQQWLGSPDHSAILSDPQWGLIGCGSHTTSSVYYAVCVVAVGTIQPTSIPAPEPTGQPSNVGGSESTSPPVATPEPVPLPNTAMGDGSP